LNQPGYKLVDPLGIPGKNNWNVIHNFVPWIWADGGELLSPDRKKLSLIQKKLYKVYFFILV